MKSIFISDLHLSPEQPELIQLAAEFVLQHSDMDTLYILGDLFNTWLGDDLLPAEYQPFISALQQLKQQDVQIFLMVGNRDFMLGTDFAERVGAELLADPTLIEIAEQPVLLMHGDSLCIDDISYQRYRRIVRNPQLQWCFLRLPLSWRQKISDKIKQKSQQQKADKPAMIMDVNPSEVSRIMAEYRVNVLIHGHTHRPAIHVERTSNGKAHRIVLGDWQQQPSFLCVDDDLLQLVDPRLPDQQLDLQLL